MTTNQIAGGRFGNVVQAGAVQAVHLHPAAPAAPAVPRQLPPVTGAWVDRESDLEQLTAAIGDRPPHASVLVAISGRGGVGKTALAVRWLAAHREDTPDGQLYADLTATDSADAAPTLLRQFLRALGHPPAADATAAELTSWWRTLTAARRLAVLLDNARDAEQIRPLLPGGQGHLIAVTARRPVTDLVGDGARLHPLEGFTPEAAADLLARLLGADRVRAEPDAVRALAARCGHRPLELCVAAARLAGHPHLSVATAAHHTNGTSVIQDSYAALPESTARTIRLLTCLPVADIDIDGAAAALGLRWQAAAYELTALAEMRMLEERGDMSGRGAVYRLPDTVRTDVQTAAQHEENEEESEEALRRWADWLLETTSRAERLLTPAHRQLDRDVVHPPQNPPPFGEEEGARGWLAAHLADFKPAVTAAEAHKWDTLVWQLPHAGWPLWRSVRPLELMLDLHRRGRDAARRCGNRPAEREMITTGVIALRGLDQYEEAITWAEEALALARDDQDPEPDRRSQAQALHELGVCHHALGNGAAAVEALSEAIAIRTAIGYARGVALSRLVLGQVALDRGETETALSELEQAHQGLLAEGDRLDSARALAYFGRACAAAGDYVRAEQCLDQACGEFRAVGSLPGYARALEMWGRIAADQGADDRAREKYLLALAIAETGSPRDADRIRGLLTTGESSSS